MNIQELIDNAIAGSIINIPVGTYHEQITIDKPLTLQGPSPDFGNAIINAHDLAQIPTVTILSNNVTIHSLTIEEGPLHGIQIGDDLNSHLTNIVISNNTIRKHGNAGIITNHNAALNIENNSIIENGQGMGFNRGGIILYPHDQTSITNNTITDNVVEGIFARESTSGLTISNNIITNHSNSGITLAWNQSHTNIIDNQIKNCGSGSVEEQGGIVIIQSLAERIQGNIIENCQHSGLFWGWVPTSGNPPVEIIIGNNRIQHCSRDGIYLFSQGPGGFIPPDLFPLEPLIKENTLQNNGRAGVYISNSYYYSPGNAQPIIHNNQIINNEWGVFNATSQIINARENWWGANNGPYQPLLNPEGIGNPVSDNVDFDPWLTEPPIVEIIECTIFEVNLENYRLIPITDDTSKIILNMKVSGAVIISSNGVYNTINVTKNFIKSVLIPVANSPLIKPTTSSVFGCSAKISNNTIIMQILIYTLLDIQGQCNLLVPTYGYCPLPNKQPKKEEIYQEPNCIASLQLTKIFYNCWFKTSLNYQLNI